MSGGVYLEVFLPLVALLQAPRLIRDDIDARTLVYWISRPIPRASILLGRFAAWFACAGVVSCASLAIGATLTLPNGVSHTSEVLRACAASCAALGAFGALFALVGVVARHPLPLGLLFLFGWEELVHAPGVVPVVTFTAHLRALAGIGHSPHISPVVGGVSLTLAFLLCLGAAILAFVTSDYSAEA